MNWREYIKGIIIWSIISACVTYFLIRLGANQSDKELIVITTERAIGVILFSNVILTAILVRISSTNWD